MRWVIARQGRSLLLPRNGHWLDMAPAPSRTRRAGTCRAAAPCRTHVPTSPRPPAPSLLGLPPAGSPSPYQQNPNWGVPLPDRLNIGPDDGDVNAGAVDKHYQARLETMLATDEMIDAVGESCDQRRDASREHARVRACTCGSQPAGQPAQSCLPASPPPHTHTHQRTTTTTFNPHTSSRLTWRGCIIMQLVLLPSSKCRMEAAGVGGWVLAVRGA